MTMMTMAYITVITMMIAKGTTMTMVTVAMITNDDDNDYGSDNYDDNDDLW